MNLARSIIEAESALDFFKQALPDDETLEALLKELGYETDAYRGELRFRKTRGDASSMLEVTLRRLNWTVQLEVLVKFIRPPDICFGYGHLSLDRVEPFVRSLDAIPLGADWAIFEHLLQQYGLTSEVRQS